MADERERVTDRQLGFDGWLDVNVIGPDILTTLVIQADTQGASYVIYRNGKRAAVLLGFGEWEHMKERLGDAGQDDG